MVTSSLELLIVGCMGIGWCPKGGSSGASLSDVFVIYLPLYVAACTPDSHCETFCVLCGVVLAFFWAFLAFLGLGNA